MPWKQRLRYAGRISSARGSLFGWPETEGDLGCLTRVDHHALHPVGRGSAGCRTQIVLAGFVTRELEAAILAGISRIGMQAVRGLDCDAGASHRLAVRVENGPRERPHGNGCARDNGSRKQA